MPIAKPFNLTAWIESNRDLLKPPVGNKNLYVESGDYIVMIVAGPNARKDYHYNETEELFLPARRQHYGPHSGGWAGSGYGTRTGRYVLASCKCSAQPHAGSGFVGFGPLNASGQTRT